MNPELKQKWIDALRSGKYRQTRDRLKSRNGSFCCLGVYCDVTGAKWVYEDGLYRADGQDFNYIPKKRAKELGITRRQQQKLAALNDGDVVDGEPKHNFTEIADHIEKNL